MDVAGTTVGPYRIGRLLGQGGMGAVHEAVDGRNGARVAFKILLRPDASSHDASQAARRLYDEATAASTLRHPFLVPLLDAGQDPVVGPWLVYPFLPGGSLRDRLDRGPLPPSQVRENVAVPLLGALAALHRRGTVHRDVKPENLLADAEGRYHLADLGLAWFEGRQARTATGVIVATPAYCSPERILRPNDPPTAACDVWAAAATLAEALTGRPLMDPEASATNLQAVLTRGYPPNELRARGLPPALADALAPALAAVPTRRPSAEALLETLSSAPDDFAAPAPTQTTRSSLRPRPPAAASSRRPVPGVPTRRRMALGALALAACLLLPGLLRLASSPAPPPAPTLPPAIAPLLDALGDAAEALGPSPLPDPLLTDRLLGTADLLFRAAADDGVPWHLVADATRKAMGRLPSDGVVHGLVTAAALQAQGNHAQAAARIEAEGARVADLLAAPGPPPPEDRPLLLAVVAGRRLRGAPCPATEADAVLDRLATRIRRLPPPLRCGDGARAARLALTVLRGRVTVGRSFVDDARRQSASWVLAIGPPAVTSLAAGWDQAGSPLHPSPVPDLDGLCRVAMKAFKDALANDDDLRSFVDDSYDGAISAAVKGLAPDAMAGAAAGLSAAARGLETLAWIAPDRSDVRLASIMILARMARCLRRALFYQNFYKPEYFAPDDTDTTLLDRLLDLLSLDLTQPRPSLPEAGAAHDAGLLMDTWVPLDVLLRNWPEALPVWDERMGPYMDRSDPVDRLLTAYRALVPSPDPDALVAETAEALRLMPLASPPTAGTLMRRAHAVLLQGRILRMAGAFDAARDQARREQDAVERLVPSPESASGPLFELWSMAVVCRATAARHLKDASLDGQQAALRAIAAHAPAELGAPRYAVDLLDGKLIIPERP